MARAGSRVDLSSPEGPLLILSKGNIMEEAYRRKPPLSVERAFAGSRLEEQILSRVYELAVPVLRRSAAGGQTPPAPPTTAEDQSQRIAQGG
jgi:hypothetical protein